jgi:uncharacterized delta-60 repeat protein
MKTILLLVTSLRPTLLLLAAGLCTALAADGVPGSLDLSFGGTGLSRLAFGGGNAWAQAEAVQPDGKMVLAGDGQLASGKDVFEVMRFGTNNVLDASFGMGGKVVTAVGSGRASQANAVAVQADGKIVAAGWSIDETTNVYFALARYETNGALDSTFGDGGTIVMDPGGWYNPSGINALGIQPDGKIVAAGTWGDFSFAIARYLTNGTLDESFAGGTVITEMPGLGDGQAYALMFDGAGNIVAAGDDGNGNFAVVRYTTNGALDTSFGGGTGMVFTPVPGLSPEAAASTVITLRGNNTIEEPDKILVAGPNGGQTYGASYCICCYNEDGSLDTSFGNGGVATNDFGPDTVVTVCGLLIESSGFISPVRKIVVGGTMFNFSGDSLGSSPFLARVLANGVLDTTFGNGGVASFAGTWANAMSYQGGLIVLGGFLENASPNGKDSLAQFEAVQSYSNGSIYTNSGNGGIMTGAGDLTAQGAAIAVQSDGKVVVAGSCSNALLNTIVALARYNSDGSLDDNFGSGGKVALSLNTNYEACAANAVEVQTNGDIVTAGYNYNGSSYDFALARFTSAGSLDTNFGSSGLAITPIGPGDDVANALALQPDGKILAAGYAHSGTNITFALARYTSAGQLDTSFNLSGEVLTPIPSGSAVAWAVQVQSNGFIVVAGQAQAGSSTNVALVRYAPNGALDASFGSSGIVTTSFASGGSSAGKAMVIQSDGRIVVTGPVFIAGNYYAGLARYTTNGALDASFGTGGQVIIQSGHSPAAAALQQDGKILIAGSEFGPTLEYFVLRFLPTGALDTSYGFAGEADISFNDGGNDLGVAAATDSIGRVIVAGDANGLMGVTRLQGDTVLEFFPVTVSNSVVQLTGLGIPNATHTISASSNLSAGTFTTLASVVADATGFWQFNDTTAVGVPVRFYKLSSP